MRWEKFKSLLQNSGLELKPMSLSLGILLSTCVSTFYHFITAFSLLQTSTLGNYSRCMHWLQNDRFLNCQCPKLWMCLTNAHE